MDADEKRADAVRVQVLRELGVDELPPKIKIDWMGLVALVDLHGAKALAETIDVIRAEMKAMV